LYEPEESGAGVNANASDNRVSQCLSGSLPNGIGKANISQWQELNDHPQSWYRAYDENQPEQPKQGLNLLGRGFACDQCDRHGDRRGLNPSHDIPIHKWDDRRGVDQDDKDEKGSEHTRLFGGRFGWWIELLVGGGQSKGQH
jgi:hypothetical protein